MSKDVEKLTLEEFLERLPLMIQAFVEATNLHIAEGDPSFPAGRRAPATWWWNEVAAYHTYTELEEQVAQGSANKEPE